MLGLSFHTISFVSAVVLVFFSSFHRCSYWIQMVVVYFESTREFN